MSYSLACMYVEILVIPYLAKFNITSHFAFLFLSVFMFSTFFLGDMEVPISNHTLFPGFCCRIQQHQTEKR
jgi:hypothetical protein